MFRVRFDSAEQRRALALVRNELRTEVPKLMDVLGVQLLSDAQLAYVEKARGGVGEDGIRWAPLKRSTLAARVRRVGRGRTIVARRKKLAKQIRDTKGKGAGKKIARLRKQRAELRQELERLIDAAVANHEIGVDTGLQRASAKPGFQGGDGEGGNVLKVEGHRVTVGYGRSYSKYFDEKRPLLPSTLPRVWVGRLEEQAEGWAEGIIRKHFRRA